MGRSSELLAIAGLVAAFVARPAEGLALLRPAAHASLGIVVMGVDFDINAVDMRLYRERFLPAYHAAERGEDFAAFADLVRTAAPLAAEAAEAPQPDPAWASSTWKEEVREAKEARQRGDPRKWDELVTRLRDAPPPRPTIPRSVLEDALATLTGTASGDEKAQVVREMAPYVVDLLCLPWTRLRRPSFDLLRSKLTRELTRRSRTLDRMFLGMGLTGGRLEISLSQSAHVMSPDDMKRLADELAQIPPADGDPILAHDDEVLRQLMEFARQNEGFALVVMTH